MDREPLFDTVQRLAALDVSSLSNEGALDALVDARRVQSWAAGRTAALRRRIQETSTSPATGKADADEVSGSSQASGRRDEQRADATGAVPEAQEALDLGDITAEHVDVIAAALALLEPDEQELLASMGRHLIQEALGTNPDLYRMRLRHLIDQLRADAGQALLERQIRANQLLVWVDKHTGMWRLSGQIDPQTAATMAQQLNAALRTRFAQETPDLCPSDKSAKASWLRAHALADIFATALDGGSHAKASGGRNNGSRAEVTIVVTSPQGQVDTGLGQAVSPQFVSDLIRRGTARLFTVITHEGHIIQAPGPLNLGRSTRVANRAQRRALHALYPTCAIPGCTVDFRLCPLHHVVWWRHGGPTDLGNLVPVCHTHHAAIHDEGWHVALGPARELTVTRPGARTLSTGPPGRGP